MRSRCVLLLIGLAPAWLAGGACADVIRLSHGGEVRGTLRPGHTRDPQITMETLTGGLVVVARGEVQFTAVRRIEFEQYELKAAAVPHTIAAHWELAEWCRQNQLRAQRDEQLEQILLLQPDHAEAHRALGHVLERGQWMTRDEQMASRGYVLHNGKYLTPQELELIEKSDAVRTAERDWYTKMAVWVRWLGGANERQQQQGIAALKAINDPAAVWGLQSHMSGHAQPAVRRLMVEVLAGIPGEAAVPALVDRSLYDVDHGIRFAALRAIRAEQSRTAATLMVPALRHADNAIVNRAAAALGELKDVRTVPALIDALVTAHSFQIQVPTRNAVTIVNGPNGPQFSDPNLVSQYLPLEAELALRAGQLPFGVQVLPPSGETHTWRTYKIQAQMQNADVLAALESVTGQHFGYDERTWKLWWAAEGQKLLSKT